MTKTKIKICVITTIALTIKTFLLDQLVYLSQNGFDVIVVCSYDKDLAQNCPKELTYKPIQITRDASLISTIKGIKEIYFFFSKNNFEIVQYSTPKAAFISAVASWAAGIPVRLYCQWGIRYVSLSGIKRLVLKFFEKLTCYFSTHISPDSFGNLHFSVDEGLYNKEKASVVNFGSANGVNLERFNYLNKEDLREPMRMKLGFRKSDFIFGWVGRVNRDKGIKELVNAFEQILDLESNSHLLMVGTMDDNHGLSNEIIKTIREHPHIHYVGPQRNMEAYYPAMDVLVAPSYREGFGVVALEAQAMGVPVISTDIPGPREAIINGKTGLLVPVAQVEPLVKAMILLKSDTLLRNRMGKEGISHVIQHFEQNSFWKKVLEHRLTLISQSRKVKDDL